MKKEEHEKTLKTQYKMFFENPAELNGEVLVDPCINCNETIHFAMRDKHHNFIIGLITVLECLHFAEEQGEVPKLPNDWWISVKNKYRFK